MAKKNLSRILAGAMAAVCVTTAVPLCSVDAVEITEGAVIYATDFEDGIVDKFTGRGGVEVMTAVTDYANSGEYSMCVSERAKGWHGPQLLLDEICEPNKEYTVSAFVRAEWYNDIKLSLEYTDAEGERHYSNLKSAVNQGDGWSEFSEVKFSFTDDVSKVYLYFEGN
ncbi:MAG: carbohydrate binding domain-containing protein, partial [Oscillospiraceae bacterium]|nr:carbohydrate binding domain-containing protein [Oscillospiraceae bacterium]